ncbi:MAG TPA: DUF885 family protein, partial [Acidimicrobiales bacterium]
MESADAPDLNDTPVFVLADRYIDEVAALDPIAATGMGISGYDDRLPDLSPDGIEARAAHERQTLVELAGIAPASRFEALAAAYQTERLGMSLALVDADEPLREINNLASPVQAVRDVFDLMSYDTLGDWEIAQRRMAAVPTALRGLRATYEAGRTKGVVAARRQALAAAEQAAVW